MFANEKDVILETIRLAEEREAAREAYEAQNGPKKWGVYLPEEKALLIHGGRGQHNGLHAAAEPVWRGVGQVADLLQRTVSVRTAARNAVAEGNDADQLFAGIDNGGTFALAVGQRDPTGAQS